MDRQVFTRRRPARANLAAWVSASGSLSAHLARARSPFTVSVLDQGRVALPSFGTAALRLPLHQAVHGRSVLLSGAGQGMVLAYSVVAQAASKGPWRAIRGLGQRPLAELLFTRLDVSRSPLQWRWLPPRDPLARRVAKDWAQATGQPFPGRGVWQRASTFRRHGQALCVSEFFVPACVQGWPRLQRR